MSQPLVVGEAVAHHRGGRGIYLGGNRVFFSSSDGSFRGVVRWMPNEIKPDPDGPTDFLWAGYCAYQLTTN